MAWHCMAWHLAWGKGTPWPRHRYTYVVPSSFPSLVLDSCPSCSTHLWKSLLRDDTVPNMSDDGRDVSIASGAVGFTLGFGLLVGVHPMVFLLACFFHKPRHDVRYDADTSNMNIASACRLSSLYQT